MVSAPSFGSESEGEDLLPTICKRQKHESHFGFLSPRGQYSACHGGPALRPPPIHTMASLEGPDLTSETPAIPALLADALQPVPPTPISSRSGFFRGSSRLAPPPSMSLVAPSLYIGDETSAASEQRLRQHGITHVLNCTAKPNLVLELPSVASCNGEPSVEYRRLNLLDSTEDLPRMQSVLREGVDFIRSAVQEGGTILVHCHRGISRSVALVMAYLIEADQRSAESVFDSIRSKRRVADPNLGYWCSLQEWEKAVLAPRLHKQRSASRLSPHPFAPPSRPPSRPLSRAG